MLIERVIKQDLQQILDLQYRAYQSEAKLVGNLNIPPLTQTIQDLENEYKKGVVLKVVDDENIIVGSVRAYSENDTLFIGKLIVEPKLQGQGIGTKLLQEIERVCPSKRYELFTSSKSERNIKLYQRLGYKIFNKKTFDNELTFIYLEK